LRESCVWNYCTVYCTTLKTNLRIRPTQYETGKHRSNALELVEKQPVIEVEGEMAICDGGGGSLGHPVEYISLQIPGVIGVCKYCALKFKSVDHHH
jgi:NADH dehydrogenase (ubiquinone) Fe-S protein 6